MYYYYWDLIRKFGSHGIEPKRDWTHFLKIGFVVAGSGFYSYYNLQCIKLDKENRIQEKKSFLCKQKTFNALFKNGFDPVLGSIPRIPESFVQALPSETPPYITENSLNYIISVNCKFIKKDIMLLRYVKIKKKQLNLFLKIFFHLWWAFLKL